MQKIKRLLISAIIPVLFLMMWQFYSVKLNNAIILPRIDSIIAILFNPTADLLRIGSLLDNIWVSLLRVLSGYILAAALAIPLGIIIGYSRTVQDSLLPFLSLFRPIPPLAWVPLVLAWFGTASFATLLNLKLGSSYVLLSNIKISMVFIIFIGAFFPILTSSIFGMNNVPNTLVDAAKTMGASQKDIILKIYLPGALPSVVTGLRVGLGVAWMCLVSAEMLPGSIAGVGYLITHAYSVARTDIVISGMITIGIIGTIFDYLFQFSERKYFHWQNS